jgi:hypothetical protein
MAKLPELSESLLKRLKDVPNVTSEDAYDWVERSMLEHGYNANADVPQNQVLLVLLYAEWDAALQIALKAAHYFEYKDHEETVDKRHVSEQYRQLATELWRTYERKKAQGAGTIGGSRFRIVTRADRN